MREEIVNELKSIFNRFTDESTFIFNTPLDNSFVVSMYLLTQDSIPKFSNISDEDNDKIQSFFTEFKNIEYTPLELRRAFSESYLLSLREKDNHTVSTTLELPMLYLSSIVQAIYKELPYENVSILNASGNIGTLISMLNQMKDLNNATFTETVNNDIELRLSTVLRDLSNYNYEVSKSLPPLDYRCDIIVSDPFLKTIEDILIFFEDYIDYLNQNGVMVLVLPTEYIRSRVFSDSLNDHSLVLLGFIEYPLDLLGGIINESIVILEKKDGENKEFFQSQMPSIKDIDENIKLIETIKEYIKEYYKEGK